MGFIVCFLMSVGPLRSLAKRLSLFQWLNRVVIPKYQYAHLSITGIIFQSPHIVLFQPVLIFYGMCIYSVMSLSIGLDSSSRGYRFRWEPGIVSLYGGNITSLPVW